MQSTIVEWFENIPAEGFEIEKEQSWIPTLMEINKENFNRITSINDCGDCLNSERKYWVISVGTKSLFWDKCKEGGFICMGRSWLSPFDSFESLDDLKARSGESGQTCSQIWNFAKSMQIGDIILVKKGQTKIMGIGKVTSDYYRDVNKLSIEDKTKYLKGENRDLDEVFSEIRDVEWFENIPAEGFEIEKEQSWIPTLMEIDEEKFNRITSKKSVHMDMSISEFYSANKLLFEKKQIILYGPPGTGKTFKTKEYAASFVKSESK